MSEASKKVAKKKTSKKSEPGFEDELASLEKVVDDLETGDLTLEQAMSQWESGFRSMKRCYALLRDAQERIEVLCASEEGSDEAWKPFPLNDLGFSSGSGKELGEDGAGPAVEDTDDAE